MYLNALSLCQTQLTNSVDSCIATSFPAPESVYRWTYEMWAIPLLYVRRYFHNKLWSDLRYLPWYNPVRGHLSTRPMNSCDVKKVAQRRDVAQHVCPANTTVCRTDARGIKPRCNYFAHLIRYLKNCSNFYFLEIFCIVDVRHSLFMGHHERNWERVAVVHNCVYFD